MYNYIKKRTRDILEKADKGDLSSKIFDFFIVCLISLNVLAVMLETVKSFSRFQKFFFIFEITSVTIFTIEYFLRLWSATSNNNYSHSLIGRIRYFFTPLMIVDLLSILPFYFPFLIPLDLRFLRIIRLFRVFRLFKLGRYSKSMKTILNVFKAKKEQLFITLFIVFILVILSSSAIYYAEHTTQPEAFSDIPNSMWWTIITLATVGYGDVYPITPIGRLLGMIISLLGIGMFALPAGILGSGFFDEIQKQKTKNITCPNCGHRIKQTPNSQINRKNIKIK